MTKLINLITIATILILIMFFICSCSKDSPPEPKKTFAQELQITLDETLESNNGIGASMTVITSNGEILNGVSGVSHGTTPISSDMIFNIASVTKTFTAALVLQLAEEEALTLEDSLHEWLPNYPNVDSTITIRQLLNHTSGVYDMWDFPAFFDSLSADWTRRWTPEETIKSFTLESYSVPGTEYHYSNNNYILLGMIIEAATGSNVATEIRNRFLGPLGLDHTFFAVEEELIGEVAHGWYDMPPEDDILEDISTIPKTSFYSIEWTAGAMFSTAEDIARWSQALFQGNVLSQSSLNQMLDFDHHSIPGVASSGYGLGITLYYPNEFNGAESIGHGGECPGYRMIMMYLPDEGIHITIMMNESNAECFWAIIDAVGDIIMN